MNTTRVLYHLMRADFLERTRRYSFLLTLGFVVYFAYLFVPPNHARYATLQMAGHRGIYNSAWLGCQVAMLTTIFLSFAGFYLIKNTITRDRQTGVGQILAATPMSKTLYVLGKALSNFAVLAVMVLVLIIATAIMQFIRAEDLRLQAWPLASPFLFLTLPTLAIIAALAVLFESLKALRGGAGNAIFYFLWTFALALDVREGAGLDVIFGFKSPLQSMQTATAQAYPEYDATQARFSMGFNIKADEKKWDLKTFRWEGLAWTPAMLGERLTCLAIAFSLTLIAAFCFDRFDSTATARVKKKRRDDAEEPATEFASPKEVSSLTLHLTPLAPMQTRNNFGRVLRAEMKLMLKGVSRWWLLVAAGLIIASVVVPLQIGRQWLLPFAWIWPLLLWSKMGTRESLHGTEQLVFSAPRFLQRQLPAAWLAGVFIALLMGSGVLLRTIIAGEWPISLALLAGALFIPTLALTFGTWSGSSKLFEVIYLILWYIGPMNRMPYADYIGVSNEALALGMPRVVLYSTLALLALMFWGRQRQSRSH